ncbi:alpha/beta fold hydrolase [Rhizobium lusitanum]|uniref:Pimeloyl-ACP methyl ester carboxylesterase n=1 Tax=Rhizobium lusitanum TaxID=293958 RepID=A0A7X0MG26_9HYPH|nr:alpha/beta hydrolase [Rhizobium lusitanum]MBB6487628.1 pimeloyl-ACP methyl ester carboxylesterase [Rhizobium lusitanum]
MEFRDDDLDRFEAEGPTPLPDTETQGHAGHDGARIWYASYGNGAPVILLHGGLGNSGNWGHQVPALIDAGYRVIVIDSRGHGRSTRDERPYTYELMASDVLEVMDRLGIEKAAVAGWSDGACIGMVLGHTHPERISGVFFFACNMDPSGTKEFVATPIIERCFSRHAKDYAALSATPEVFDAFVEAVGLMQRTEPNYAIADLAEIKVPVAIVHSEHDEFIKREHADYLVRHIPGAEMILLPGVSHFAPVQRPAQFNAGLLGFLARIAT